jgi:hypothetical protein
MSSITVKKDIPEIIQFLRELRQNAVESGLFVNLVPKETMIAATVNEFGAVIKMTDQMRKWFWAQMAKYGLRKKAATGSKSEGTGFIVIPARPFVQGGLQRQASNILEAADRLTVMGLQRKISAQDALEAIGLMMERAMKDEVNRITEPPLHPLTVAKKGTDKPLVKSGAMRAAITNRVVRR